MSTYLVLLVCAVALASLSATLIPFVPAPTPTTSDAQAPRRRMLRWSPFDALIVIGLIAFSAVRFEVGTDYGMYMRFFQMIDPAVDWWSQVDLLKQEVGYTVLSLVVKLVTSDPHAILWVTSALTITPIYMVLRRESRDLAFSILLYICLAFYVAPFNIIRQGIAYSFSFWAYSFLGRPRQRWAYVLLNTISVLFHSSALIAIVIQLVARRWRPTPKSTAIVLLLGAGLAGGLFAVPGVRDLLGSFNTRYAGYVEGSHSAGFGTYLTIVAFLAMAIVPLVLKNNKERPDWQAMVVIGVVLLMIGTQVVEVTRMSFYFTIFTTSLIPNVLAGRKGSAVVKVVIALAAVAYFVMYLLSYADLLPYQTYI